MDFLNYGVLLVYIVAMVVIAMLARKKGGSLNDFLFAGKGLGGWFTAFAFGTTYFSSVILIGYASNLGWDFGLAAIWIGVGNALFGSYFAWKIMARRTKNLTSYLNVKTMPEFFESRYASSKLKLYSGILIFIFLIPYSASVYQGLGYLFEYVFKIDFIWCILIIAALTAVYLIFGGYLATAISDFVQGIIMIGGVAIMVYFVLSAPEVNFLEGFKTLTEKGLGLIPSATSSGNFFTSPMFNLIVLVLLTSFGIYGLPQSIHKFYAIKDEKAIKRGTVVSTAFCGFIGVCAYLVGTTGRLFFTSKPVLVDTIVPDILIKVLPAGLLGLVVVLVLSASMSTLSSLSLAGASAFSVDVYKGFINKNAEDKKVKLITRLLCLVFVAISAFFAIMQIDVIVVVMGLSWGTLAGSFIGPYVLGLYDKKINKHGVWASFITCIATTIILIIVFGYSSLPNNPSFFAILKAGISKSPLIGVICMILSVIVTPLVSRLFKVENENEVKKMFAQLK